MNCVLPSDHMYVVIFRRPWRRLWRKTNVLRCWHCDLEIAER